MSDCKTCTSGKSYSSVSMKTTYDYKIFNKAMTTFFNEKDMCLNPLTVPDCDKYDYISGNCFICSTGHIKDNTVAAPV